MNSEDKANDFRMPSRKSLVNSSLIAVVAAAVILATIILPAEHNIDPTGFGKLLGLTELSGLAHQAVPAGGTVNGPGDQAPRDAADANTAGSHRGPYRTDTIEIAMAPGDELEYKAALARDEPLLYSWETDNEESLVYYDFHGEPAENDGTWPEGYFKSYEEKQDGASSSHGYLIAPFTGNHGWYLLNFTDHPVTVRLKISGNYSWHGYIARWNNYVQVTEAD
jgi:hypothetical protein